jgi:SET domain-containing protein
MTSTINIAKLLADLKYRIDKSPIAGMGVFATQDIPAGFRLADYEGEEMSLKDFKTQYGNDISHTYSMRRVNKIICGKKYFNVSHYMNESNDPNCILKQRGIYTLVSLKEGDEMFLKYPKKYIRDYVL